MTESSKPQLSFSTRADGLAGLLRNDAIRHDTLVQLVQHWAEPQSRDDVINQLDALAEAVQSPREGELDALVQQMEDAAGMDDAEIEVDMRELLRLRAELDAVIEETAGRFNPERSRGASLINHPTHKATVEHLREHPLPEQRGIGGAA